MDRFFKGRAGFFKSWGYNFLNRQVISTEVITMLFFTFWLIIFKLKPILAKTEEKYCSTLPSTQFLLLLIFCWISETRHLSVIKFWFILQKLDFMKDPSLVVAIATAAATKTACTTNRRVESMLVLSSDSASTISNKELDSKAMHFVVSWIHYTDIMAYFDAKN